MRDWLRLQWNDIKGNVKFALFWVAGVPLVTAVLSLFEALSWRDVALLAGFTLLFGWASITTWMATRSHNPKQQPGPAAAPAAPAGDVALAVLDTRPEPEAPDGTKLRYRRKIRVVLRNDTGQQITVWAPDWISNRSTIPFQPPFWSAVQKETTTGAWRLGAWKQDQSHKCILVGPGETFMARVGLSDSFSVNELLDRLPLRGVGTLVLPVTINGRDLEWRQDL